MIIVPFNHISTGGNKINMVYDRIKLLRENLGITQSELAKRLGITRSSVNSWEMGLNIPSAQYLVELSRIFKVSTDYILGLDCFNSLDVSDLDDEEIKILHELASHFRNSKK